MSDVIISTLNAEEIPEVVALWHECGLTRPNRNPELDARLAIDGPTSAILVGKLDGTIVSSTMVGFEGHRGWLYFVAAKPSIQGRGLGAQIVDAGVSWLRERGAPKVMLMVRHSNEQVLGFYRNMGFVPEESMLLGKWFGYAGGSAESLAESLARRAHAGQVDKSGADYILHIERVANLVRGILDSEDAIAAAWLHDVLEDNSDITADQLREVGISEATIEAVELLTKRPETSLEEYFAGIRSNPIARAVKVADLTDNTSPARMALLDAPTATQLRKKYQESWRMLLG